ncbi:MAG: hypothetical protein ABW080_15780 [Candidatus Thiodiazotropha sp.]
MKQFTGIVLQVGAILVALMVTGCASINPDDHAWRDFQEEGPKRGLFTGPDGEWVIYR